ncbi:MAG: alpha-galactosidase [Lachnospiraceae bacterium]|nr:alpha-galactosidase [Lachnospiraceae bacterium]
MIQVIDDKVFVLTTAHTTYAFGILPTGQPEHLAYGGRMKIDKDTAELLGDRHAFSPGNAIVYDAGHPAFSLEDARLEASFYGKGDIREPFAEIVYEDGSFTSDFLYDSYLLTPDEYSFEELPGAYAADASDGVESLKLTLKEKHHDVYLDLYYTVFPACDVITRRSVLRNEEKSSLTVLRLMSMQLDLGGQNWNLTSFTGAWTREMEKHTAPVRAGKTVISSYTGTSSNRANPFVMVHPENTGEDHGKVYGFNLVYSGNHYEALEAGNYGGTRFVSGMNPQSFSWKLMKDERLVSPEAVLSYSSEGFNGLSHALHAFVRRHIVRGFWKDRVRPLLLNSWEASYFKINESKLLKLAKAAKDVGIDLFVMDDGWFGTRSDDTQSLGDWTPDPKKLPGGVEGLARKIDAQGLRFGLWVEPEMVNVNSDLYRAHPDWCLDNPEREHSEGRNQRILDLSRKEVQDWIIETMKGVFSRKGVTYVKWDMNRIVSDAFSRALPAERQGEVLHRYVLGLYRVMKELTEAFPEILFEGCASGGNRFDLGILSYFPQIWASDDTDAWERARIQTAYSYGYPMSTVTAHVSASPNHQTLRKSPLETRFEVASFGVLGYELNLLDLKKEDYEKVKVQTALYRKWQEVMQYGTFWRVENEPLVSWTVVSPDRKRAVGMILQGLVSPNTQQHVFRAAGLDPDLRYHFYGRDIKYNVKGFGDLINQAAPVHVKDESVVQEIISRFVKMEGEKEDGHAYGSMLMEEGVHLAPAFGGTGYDNRVRFFQDFSARMYFMEAEENQTSE